MKCPSKKCTASFCASGKIYLIGYNKVTPEQALQIARKGFELQSGGIFGSAIYFTRAIEKKAYKTDAIVCAVVDAGKTKEATLADPSVSLESLNREGFHSIYGKATPNGLTRDEFAVYSPERVVEWIIIYPE